MLFCSFLTVYLKALCVGVKSDFHFLLHILENVLFFFLIMYYIYLDKSSSFLSEQNKKTQLHKKTLYWVNLTFGEKGRQPRWMPRTRVTQLFMPHPAEKLHSDMSPGGRLGVPGLEFRLEGN